MEKTAIFWIRDGVLVDRMHVNPVAFAVAAIAHASAKQASRADLTELVNFAFATSGISCADKMKRFNSECFELIGDVPAASDYYNRLCAAAAEQCHYFKGACELLARLKAAGALNFITSAVEQSVLDSWRADPQGRELSPHLTEILGQRDNFKKGEDHFAYVQKHYGATRIIYVADAVAEIETGARFSQQFKIMPIGFAHVITAGKVRLAHDLILEAHGKLSPSSHVTNEQLKLEESRLTLPDQKALGAMLQEAHAAYIVGGDSASIVANLSDKFQALGVLSKEDARVSDVFHVSIATAAALESTSVRAGETKVGQGIKLLESADPGKLRQSLAASAAAGARYALLGVPEDLGPRANLGRGGADKAWPAFLQFFLNMQSNQYLDASKIVLVGSVDLSSVQEREKALTGVDGNVSTADLRELCAALDELVYPIVRECVAAGLKPMVIGGGNNNSYPTLKGVVSALRAKHNDQNLALATVNCDPHADFRVIEGRHSGNPFTCADRDGLLKAYCVLGAHENYNSADMLSRMAERSYPLFFFDDVVRGKETWEQQVAFVIDYLAASKLETGLELDLDGIKNMPSSAKTPFGISEEQAFYFVYKVASSLDSIYLHLSEAAPRYAGDGERTVGKVIAKTVVEYLRGCEDGRRRRKQGGVK